MSELTATVEHPSGGAAEHGEHGPTLLGLSVEGWVYASITIFLVLAFVLGKLPKRIGETLDKQIADKRRVLDEAAAIRAEAQAMLEDAKTKLAASAKDAEKMLEHARMEAEEIVSRAEADTTAMIQRRAHMAEEKIAASERAALDALRREAAQAATSASRQVIADTYDEASDRKLAEDIISGI
ncbi:MAG: hypothetical protein ABGW87_05550 [Sphingomonadaceae bacterium]